MSKYLKYIPNCIFVMLGHECNSACQYCLQRPTTENPVINTEIDNCVPEFLREMAINSNNNVTIQFFGGEPLLYWDTIKQIVKSMDNAFVNWSVVSNGKLLTMDKVKYLNDHNFHVALSWDGRNSSYTRGYDFFSDIDRTRIFMEIKNPTISGVLSSMNYPNDFIEDFMIINRMYIDKHCEDNIKSINCNTDEIFDLGGMRDPKLLIPDYKELRRQSNLICDEFRIMLHNGDYNTIKVDWVNRVIQRIKASLNSDVHEPVWGRCENGYTTLNVDLKGNLYRCHNTNDKVGHICDPLMNVIRSVADKDTTKQRYLERCKDCSVQTFCLNGCPSISSNALHDSYCSFFINLYEPVYELLLEIAEDSNNEDPS